MTAKIAATATFSCLLALALPLRAQDSLLGHHKIDLELEPLPAAEVLNLLSVRSKSAAHSANRPADAGRAWEVTGAEQLEGIVVKVNFVATPVSQVVAETLGCIGFAYQEQDNHIVIEKAAQALPADSCRSVSRVSASASGRTRPAPDRKYSWQFASISALEFMTTFARQSGQNYRGSGHTERVAPGHRVARERVRHDGGRSREEPVRLYRLELRANERGDCRIQASAACDRMPRLHRSS